jgi:hypothetical protein
MFPELVKKFTTFCRIQRLVTVFTFTHWARPWARWTKSTISHPIYVRSVLTLYSLLGKGTFPSNPPSEIMYVFLIVSVRTTLLAHSIFYNIWWRVQIYKSLRYIIWSILLLVSFSEVQMFSSASTSQTPQNHLKRESNWGLYDTYKIGR